MIDKCAIADLPYGLFLSTRSARALTRACLLPGLDQRWGHERDGPWRHFHELDTPRACAAILPPAGSDPLVSKPHRYSLLPSIVSPSVLFDELEVKRADNAKEKAAGGLSRANAEFRGATEITTPRDLESNCMGFAELATM